ncbi:MAG: 3-phosphoshikimate 1-carboxyvinyltransferase, partial [Propionibacterium sp.]|nr:3-phosphoshikimate 1-carboxyvinyltransferase [Propionibacterium sp.]
MTGFRLKTVQAAVRGTAEVPGSKSETNRALVLSALAEAPSTVSGVLDSRDCALMMDALRGLGVTIDTPSAGTLRIQPPAGFRGVPDGIDCGLAGTVMRFAPPLAALADAPTRFFGDAQATKRPMLGLLDGLRQLGAKIDANSLPFTLSPGPFDDDAEVAVDSSASSQFISGMLMIGARLPSGLRLRHTGLSVPSRPHIAMTIDMLRARGVHVDEPDSSSWRIHPGPIRALDLRIEP